MNFTADLVADALFNIEMIRDKICRIYSSSREDIFNVIISELPEWSILHKMLFDEFTKKSKKKFKGDKNDYKQSLPYNTFNLEHIDECSPEQI